ncbi:ribosomal protein S24E [Caldisphaera lagunensis DSM 15908]|uniref:Small ribosomal subunit protein eS24 n=1 Tax=Caldisphaera lagunensis (strain DSM 15908 / JCM 11604 / ANMR 0165 / IC-154) TaxID=1056495 RepID=L0A807_CALLD|nr:30S ribosomal protein S24e [Caldisphaera lagunensis]AFZ70003.1 ribosomal protein S24E [Caldisphaera lagunensis DSM 15908]
MSKKINIDNDVYLEVLDEKENKLLERLEVYGIVHHELKSTPSRITLRKILSQAYSKDISQIFVKSIKTSYGQGISNVHIHIYNTPEFAKKYELKYIVDRNGGYTLEG